MQVGTKNALFILGPNLLQIRIVFQVVASSNQNGEKISILTLLLLLVTSNYAC